MENLKKPEHITVLAVDADIVCYRVAAVFEHAKDMVLFEALDEFMHNIVRNSGVNKMVMFISDKTNFRYKVAVTQPYKGNRKSIVRPHKLGEAKEYMMQQHRGYIYENMEADDCIASYMTQHDNVAHAGIDKDIRQIQGWHFNFVKNIWEFTSEEESSLKLFRQICQGDTSDYIPGLVGIGEKKAAYAVTNPYTAYEDAFALYNEVMRPIYTEKYEQAAIAGKPIAKYKGTIKEQLDQEVQAYFDEQSTLVTMVDDLEIPYESYVTINPPKVFEADDDEDGFIGFDEEPKPTLDLDSKPKIILE